MQKAKSPEKEKPHNFREMMKEMEKMDTSIDTSPNILPSTTKTTSKPPAMPNLSLNLAPPKLTIPQKENPPQIRTDERPSRLIGKSSSFSETFDDSENQQNKAKRQASNNVDKEDEEKEEEDEVFYDDPKISKRKTILSNGPLTLKVPNDKQNRAANDIEKRLLKEKAKAIKTASDKVYNNPDDCKIQDIAITLGDINNRLIAQRQDKAEENNNLIEMMGKLLDDKINPLNRKLESITEIQDAQEEKIKLNTDARIRFEKAEKEIEDMSKSLDVCNTFVFANKTAIPDLKTDVDDMSKRLEKIEAELAKNNSNPIRPSVTINHHTNGGKMTPKQWEEQLTKMNDDVKLHVMIFIRNEKAKSKKEAEEIVERINREIEKVSKEKYGEDITIPPREVTTTLKHNAIRVKCKNLNEKFDYTDLVNFRAKAMNVRADKEVTPPYLSKYAQYNDLAFHIRKTKEYAAKITIRGNWMYLEARKKSNTKGIEYEWEIVENNQFYPPIPGTKEHSEANLRKSRTNSSIRKETLMNTGDLEKLKRTIIVDTSPINIIPQLTPEHKTEFITYLNNLVISEHPGRVVECTQTWKENALEIQCKDIENANIMVNTIQSKPLDWENGEQRKVYIECSLLGMIKSKARQNSFSK